MVDTLILRADLRKHMNVSSETIRVWIKNGRRPGRENR